MFLCNLQLVSQDCILGAVVNFRFEVSAEMGILIMGSF